MHCEKRIKCQECEEKFGTEYDLKPHMKTHSELSPKFLCLKCGKEFTRKGNLVRHKLRKHGLTNLNLDAMKDSYENENGYVCKMCGINFAEELEEFQDLLF